jgi:type VI secretion system lysozyme-like protein
MEGQWGSRDVARALLFDRLVDENPYETREHTPLRGYSRDDLYISVRRELWRLLNTRCPIRGDVALTRERTTLDYGLPDLLEGGRGVLQESDKGRIAKLIRRTIEAFEPRLKNVDVEVIQLPAPGGKLVISIDAVLAVEKLMEPLSFTMPIGAGEAEGDGG